MQSITKPKEYSIAIRKSFNITSDNKETAYEALSNLLRYNAHDRKFVKAMFMVKEVKEK